MHSAIKTYGKWPAIVIGAVGLLVSLQALGWVMPWNALAKSEIEAVDQRVDTLEQKFEKIDGKLDILIELHKK